MAFAQLLVSSENVLIPGTCCLAGEGCVEVTVVIPSILTALPDRDPWGYEIGRYAFIGAATQLVKTKPLPEPRPPSMVVTFLLSGRQPSARAGGRRPACGRRPPAD